MQIVSLHLDTMHGVPKPFFWEKDKKTKCIECQSLFSVKIRKVISKYRLLKFLPITLSIKKKHVYFLNVFFAKLWVSRELAYFQVQYRILYTTHVSFYSTVLDAFVF